MRRIKTFLTLAAVTGLAAMSWSVVDSARIAHLAAQPAVLPAVPTEAAVDDGPTPAVPRPARPLSMLSLDGRDTPFPAAKLTVTRTRGGLHAILCTDDPPAAMESDYAGNSFMFDMRLPVDRPSELPATNWDYSANAPNADATGLFLHGDRDQLQPAPGVRVTFQKDGPALLAYVSGPFTRLDSRDPTAPPERVQVYGCVRCLPAER